MHIALIARILGVLLMLFSFSMIPPVVVAWIYQDAGETPFLVAFGVLFAATLVVGALVNHLLGEVVRVTGLTSTDRLLGMVFGAVRGMVLVVVLVALGQGLFDQDPWWRESMLVPRFAMMEDWSRELAVDFMNWVMKVEPVE